MKLVNSTETGIRSLFFCAHLASLPEGLFGNTKRGSLCKYVVRNNTSNLKTVTSTLDLVRNLNIPKLNTKFRQLDVFPSSCGKMKSVSVGTIRLSQNRPSCFTFGRGFRKYEMRISVKICCSEQHQQFKDRHQYSGLGPISEPFSVE